MKTGSEEENMPVNGPVVNLLAGLVDEETLTEVADIGTNKTAPAAKEKTPKTTVDKPVENDAEEEEEDQEEEKADDKKKTPEKNDTKAKKDEKDSEEKEEESEEEEDEDEPELKENKFGLKIGKKKDDKKSAKLEINSFDELPNVLKTKYGQDIKNPKALPKFFETVDKWRSDSQNLEKVTKEKENAIAVFEQLPADLLDAVKMHYEGQDYRKVFEGNERLDFSKPVEKHKTKTLVNAYFPGEFTDEDFDAEEPSKELKIAIKASEKEYKTEKSAREQRAADHVEKAKRKSEAYKASVKSSVTALKSAFPDMGADVQADVEQTLSSGALMSEFFNPDGTYKPHAAKMLMLAKHGEELIEQLMAIAERRGESNANEEMVKRSPGKPKDRKGNKEVPVRKEVEDHVEKMLPQGLFNKRTF